MESDNLLINEIAFRLGDENFNNFARHQYQRVLQRIKRQISRKYKLDKRVYEFNNVLDSDIPIELPSFISPVSLSVNNVEYTLSTKIDEDSSENHYVLYKTYNKLVFDYHPKYCSKDRPDRLVLVYSADIKTDNDYLPELEPIIPEQYNEEMITYSIIEMCKIGISKFSGEEGAKYVAILNLYNKDIKEYDQNLVKKEGWTVIKPKWVV